MNETKLTGMTYKIKEMAARIRELREISGLTVGQMAERTGTSVEEYIRCEAGEKDLNIAFLYRCTLSFRVDMSDLI
jgi:acetyl-CoA synthetase